jgi:hypothetical protein
MQMQNIGILRDLRSRIWEWQREFLVPDVARSAQRRDSAGVPAGDPGIEMVIDAGVRWLARAQDRNALGDDGVARHYSLVDGWSTSYPETTGYIIPTLLEAAADGVAPDGRERALRMADWLVSIQLECGGFQGGKIDASPVIPITFNTGQILLGLAAAAREDGRFERPMIRAADWLAETQDNDGCWRKHSTPFAAPGDKAYETHVAWGLFEADRVCPDRGYREAGLRQVNWAIGNQSANGWVANCCLNDPHAPLTHTLGYFLRGVVEAYRCSREETLLAAACRTADGLMSAQASDGSIPGCLSSSWKPAVKWRCLTGISQIAESWLMLFEFTGNSRYLAAATAGNRFVRRTIDVSGEDDNVRGAVKGSFPISGRYCRYEYPNWATKFTIDSNRRERRLRPEGEGV